MGVKNFSSTIYEVYLTNKSGEMTVYVHYKWMEDKVTINTGEGLGNSIIIYEVYQTSKSGEETVCIPSRDQGDKVTFSMEEVGRYEMLWGHET